MKAHPSVFARIRRTVLLLAVLALVAYFMVCGWVIYCAQPRAVAQADAAIILGAAAYGAKPSPVFVERIRHAVNLYHAGTVRKLIFTGGTPKPGFLTEAEVGARWAIKNGVPARNILIDNTSRNTLENLRNAARFVRTHELHTVVVVSDPYHMARAALMAEDLGLDAQMSPTPTSRFNSANIVTKLKFFHQECYDFAAYGLLHWLEKSQAVS